MCWSSLILFDVQGHPHETGKGLFLWPLGFIAAVSFLPRRKVSRHTGFFFSHITNFIKLSERTNVHLIQTLIFRWEEHDPGKLVTCLETHGLLEAGARIQVVSLWPQHPTPLSTSGSKKDQVSDTPGLTPWCISRGGWGCLKRIENE